MVKTECNRCGASILTETAQRTAGLCMPCAKERDSPQIEGHSFGTWALIILFAISGIYGLLSSVFSDSVSAHMPKVFDAHTVSYALFEKLLSVSYTVLELVFVWMLYRLRSVAIAILWAYFALSTAAFVGRVAFSEDFRLYFSEPASWPFLLIGYALWLVPFWYLYRIKGQGRLS